MTFRVSLLVNQVKHLFNPSVNPRFGPRQVPPGCITTSFLVLVFGGFWLFLKMEFITIPKPCAYFKEYALCYEFQLHTEQSSIRREERGAARCPG